jgi:membrane-associated phospholipid phosphatase
LRHAESLALAYFAYLAAIGWLRTMPFDRRLQVTAGGLTMCAAIVLIGRTGGLVMRQWAPLGYVLAGYYLCGRLFVHPSTRVESWLLQWDRRLLGDPATRFARWPPWILAYLEIVYMGCFMLVPAGFAALALTGHAALADRYWTMVLGAEFGAFAPLPIIQTRPPWAIESKALLSDRAVHRVAAIFVRRATIGANTFPSGHVAGSLAVAFAVIGTLPLTGFVLLGLALSIIVATVVGRYHYIIDAITGAALALAIWGTMPVAGL